MLDGIQKGFAGLARQRSSAGIGDGAGNDQGKGLLICRVDVVHGGNRRFRVQCVEYGFDQKNIDAASDQPLSCLGVGLFELVKINVAKFRSIDVR